MKKRILAFVMMFALVAASFGIKADAAETKVYVTIANGSLVLTQAEITVTDIDGDNALTVNDALYCAHEAKFEGGAAAGYASETGAYGLSLTKLWGVANGGSYGYYLNNTSCWSLTDTVKDGDYLYAFVYTDLSTWSDTYCFFDAETVTAKTGEDISLVLKAAGYDASYNPIQVALADATITVDGTETTYKTDADGKVTIKINDAGSHVISAVKTGTTLVPPVCTATVSAAPKTGEVNALPFAAMGIVLFAGVLVVTKRKEVNE